MDWTKLPLIGCCFLIAAGCGKVTAAGIDGMPKAGPDATSIDGSASSPDGSASSPDGSASSPDGSASSPDGAAATCGDGVVEPGEACDDGTVYSSTMPKGVCRPDCKGPVLEKKIAVTSTRVSPSEGGISGLDQLCQTSFGSGYKALVVDGVNRIASTSPYAGDGQVGWVLHAYTRYVSAETGKLVFITDQTRLLGGVGGTAADLYNPIRATDDGWGGWFGAKANWTSGPDCNHWTSNSSTVYGLSTSLTVTSSGSFPNNGSMSTCANTRRFVCVQQ